jgi:hypothetical protein
MNHKHVYYITGAIFLIAIIGCIIRVACNI